MQLAQRAICVKREPRLATCSQEQVAAFRRARGFGEVGARPADLGGARFVKFGDAFVDEKSGWVHICDQTCAECTPDKDNNCLVRGWASRVWLLHTLSLRGRADSGNAQVCMLTGRVHGQVLSDEGDGRRCDDPLDCAADDPGETDFQPGACTGAACACTCNSLPAAWPSLGPLGLSPDPRAPGWLGRAYEDGYSHAEGDDAAASLVSPALLEMAVAACAPALRKGTKRPREQGVGPCSDELLDCA